MKDTGPQILVSVYATVLLILTSSSVQAHPDKMIPYPMRNPVVSTVLLGKKYASGEIKLICTVPLSEFQESVPSFLNASPAETETDFSHMPLCTERQSKIADHLARHATLNSRVAGFPAVALVTCGVLVAVGAFSALESPDKESDSLGDALATAMAGAALGMGYDVLATLGKIILLDYNRWEKYLIPRAKIGATVGFVCAGGGYVAVYWLDHAFHESR